MELSRRTAEVTDADIDETIERLRQMRASHEPVERTAAEGDQVLIDFKGTVDGEPFEGGEAFDYTLELGGGRHLPEMEQGLVGAEPGETRTVDVPFPEDYPKEDLAGKSARFKVAVKEVREKRLPELDEEFLKGFGVEDGQQETLRQDVREGLEREIAERGREELRRQIFDRLVAANDFGVPGQLVERQLDRIIESHKSQYRQQGMDPDTLDLDSPATRNQFRETAATQVKVGLLVPEIARVEGIEVSDQEVRQELQRAAEQYGPQRDQFLQMVSQNPQQYQEFEGRALETKVIDWIVDNARVTDEPVSAGTLLGWEEEAGTAGSK